jgi:hypothetical protein
LLRAGKSSCFMAAGHHVSAFPRLDREPVKAMSPEWGRSEAESLDRVDVEPKNRRRDALVLCLMGHHARAS